MTEVLILFCTCGDRAEASRIANALVEEKLAACVNILPGIESVYRWQEKVETAEEVLLLIKTTAARLAPLEARIVALHSYDTPEILAVPIAAGLDRYLSWLRAQV